MLGDAIPLAEVAFVVVDLETTGGSPVDDAITEIGAVRFHGVERVGSFQSLVDPERPIPPYIAHLTGIDDRLVAGAPGLAQILPSFLEFARGAVIVAHNATFDVGFLNANLLRLDYDTLPAPGDLHGEARAAPGLARRAEREVAARSRPTSARARSRPTARSTTPRPRARCSRACIDVGQHLGHPDAGRARTRVQRARAAALREDRAGQGPSPIPGRLRLPRPRGGDPVRRQGQGPALAREVLLLRRRAQEGPGSGGLRGPDRRARRPTVSSRRSSWRSV